MAFEHEPAGYQVCLYVGALPTELAAARCIDLTPAGLDAEHMLDALASAGIDATDLRAKAIISLDCDAPTAILAYTALTSFAGRHLDALVGDQLIQAASLVAAGTKLHQPRPAHALDGLQVGAGHDAMPAISLAERLTEEDALNIRWARRLRFVPDIDPATALSQFIVITAIRSRPAGERYPFLVEGHEPAAPEDAPLTPVGIDLDDVRSRALAIRRSVKSGERDALADFVEPSPRRAHLAQAANLPIEETMARLGARYNEATELWHCPRPERHTHGDATASMRIQRGRVRCYRCDAERVDSLRLVSDTLGLSPDEAAAWLLSGQTRVLAPTTAE